MKQSELPEWMVDSHPEAVKYRLKANGGVVKIPQALLTSKEIRHPPSIILYGILLGMSNKYERLFVGNQKLMKLLGVKSTNSITAYLNELSAGRFVSLSYAHTGQKTVRQIKLNCIPTIGNYLSIPLEIVKDKELTALQQLIIGCVYSILWKYKTQAAIISVGDVSKMINRPSKTIRNNIGRLIKKGYLERRPHQALTVRLNKYELEETMDFDKVNS